MKKLFVVVLAGLGLAAYRRAQQGRSGPDQWAAATDRVGPAQPGNGVR
ncbi:MAG: DLW-39 family protein [Actinomycetota bacterium]|nr:DLW-39 family protein [Actinomycetota bacterium]